MPQQAVTAPVQPYQQPRQVEDPRRERTKVFEKTKMCKFFILGSCSRGPDCHFAHDKEALNNLPNLYRTKLCKTLINTGRCDQPDCRYAHCKDELRIVRGFSSGVGPKSGGPEAHGGAEQLEQMQPRQPEGQPVMPQQRQPLQQQLPQRQQQEALQQQLAAMQMAAEASNIDLSLQATMMQIGQAAHAHAAEAVRLQAMAACLQAHGGRDGAALAAAMQQHFPHGAGALQQGAGAMQPAMALMVPPAGATGASAAVGANASPMMGFTGPSSGMSAPAPAAVTGSGGRHPKGGGAAAASRDAPRRGYQPAAPAQAPLQLPTGGPSVVVKNTFVHMEESLTSPTPGRLRMVKTAGASLESLAKGDGSGSEPLGPVAAGAVPERDEVARVSPLATAAAAPSHSPGEPMQIHPGSLRSLSSQDLKAMGGGGDDSDDDEATGMPLSQRFGGAGASDMPRAVNGQAGATASTNWNSLPAAEGLSWKIKNTFLSFEASDEGPQASPMSGRLRTVCSAAGRLDSLAEGLSNEVGPPEPVRASPSPAPLPPSTSQGGPSARMGGQARGSAPSTALGFVPENETPPPEKRSQDDDCSGASDSAAGAASQAAGSRVPVEDADGEARAGGGASADAWSQLPSSLSATGVTVKNTFLNFATEEPMVGLRSVHTAGGRLDLMGQE